MTTIFNIDFKFIQVYAPSLYWNKQIRCVWIFRPNKIEF